MNIQSKVIRLASINAALKVSDMPKHIMEERDSIISSLLKEKLIVSVKEGEFRFTDGANSALYEESFSDFNS